jgi:hypothetical protein
MNGKMLGKYKTTSSMNDEMSPLPSPTIRSFGHTMGQLTNLANTEKVPFPDSGTGFFYPFSLV